jgi:hypothetical protein
MQLVERKISFLKTGCCLKFHSFSFFFTSSVLLSTAVLRQTLSLSLFQQEASHLVGDLPASGENKSEAAAMARPSRLYLLAYNSLQSLGW